MIHVCYCLFFQDATGGRGADVIVEMLANASLSKDLKLVANKGRIGVIDHFRFHGIGLGLACNGGSFGEYHEMKFICIPAVQINFILHLIPVTGKDELDNWSALNIWVFIAQLVEHCSANAEAMGSNPLEALKIFFRLKCAIP